jgi:peptide/nickel transport system substrate-binding protein
MLAWSGRVDPDGNLYAFLHSGGVENYGHYSSPAMDKLLEQARTELDMAKRKALYGQVAELGQKDLPISYIFSGRYFNGMSAKVTGFKPIPDGMIRLQGISIAQ